MAQRARPPALIERMRVRRPLMFLAQSNAAVELLTGDLAATERELRTAVDLALEFGERDEISTTAARLSFVLRAEKRSREGGELCCSQHADCAIRKRRGPSSVAHGTGT